MAEFLASIFGTEKDRVNCPFYFKTGACTHGERCSRQHNRPTYSQTVLLNHMYKCPVNFAVTPEMQKFGNLTEEVLNEHFNNFFEDIFCEMEDEYGPVEEFHICENLGDHLIGNIYIMFKKEEDAQKAVDAMNNRWYDGAPIYAELSPVTDFREACCRQHETSECTRGGYCNFLHVKPASREVRHRLGIAGGHHSGGGGGRGGDGYGGRGGGRGGRGGYGGGRGGGRGGGGGGGRRRSRSPRRR